MRILVAEDHPALCAAIERRLRARGDSVDTVTTGAAAIAHMTEVDYDVVILDRMMTDGDAIDRLHALRGTGDRTPVLILTSRHRIEDRIEGLEAGADDYLVKPFAMGELFARLTALARRRERPRSSILGLADLVVDSGRREVRRGGLLIPLRPKEFSLLELLISRSGRTVTHEDILASCWDTLETPSSNVEEVLVASLRRKLGRPTLIRTVRGVGYRLEAPSHEP